MSASLSRGRLAGIVASLLIALQLLAGGAALAVEPDEVLADPAMEMRARDITAGLRCLVCQNQSVDDSHATLARDLRLLVRERLKAGDTDDDVRRYLVARYGEFVLLKPPLNAGTLLLWGLPFALLCGGAIVLLRTRRTASPASRLTAEEEDELRRLVS